MNLVPSLTPALLEQLPEPLRAVLTQLVNQLQGFQAQVQTLQNQNQSLIRENQLLRQKLDALIRRHFGSPKSESVDPNQLELLLAGLSSAAVPPAEPPDKPVTAAKPPVTRRPARSGFPDNLPVERVVLVPEEVQANPDQFRQIDEVVTRELDYQPGRFFWRQYVRPKFVRKAESSAATVTATAACAPAPTSPIAVALALAAVTDPPEVLIAALPNRLVEKGLPGVGLLVYLILSRFEDHLPFYRLEKIFRQRHQVPLARQTLMDWTDQVANWFLPIYRQMKQELLAGNYLQVDETPIWYLDREAPGRCRKGYFWVYSRPGGDVLFEWNISRGREGPKAFLQDFSGRLQCDGYDVYPCLAADRKDWILLFCWTHVRRRFFQAQKHDRRAAWFVKQISLLYALERRLRNQKSGPALRQAARSAEANMILARIQKALQRFSAKVLPESLLGQAIRYTLNLWPGLTRYVDYGDAEIDSNLVENSIRPTAIGKKNFLFIGHPDTGWRSAVLYSILGSCHRYGINPAQYLRDVLSRLPDMQQSQIPSVTPKAWAKAHPEARVLPNK